MTKPTLGFIGIGDMGAPMAGRLLDAGFPLVVYDVRDEAVAALTARGAEAATSPRTVADAVELTSIKAPCPKIRSPKKPIPNSTTPLISPIKMHTSPATIEMMTKMTREPNWSTRRPM